jgi:hypothetical protein
MHVLAHIHGCVIIHNMCHVLDIQASGYEIRADEPKDESVHVVKQGNHSNMSISCALNLPKTDLRSEGLRSLE